MNTSDKEKEHIITHLHNMPEIKDKRTKHEIWQRIELHKEKNGKKTRKKPRHLFPIFSTVLVIGILVIMVPRFIDDDLMNTGSGDHLSENSVESKNMDSGTIVEGDDS